MVNLATIEEKGALMIERGEGVYVWENQGKQYIEGLAGLWSTALGYGNKELAQVAHDQIVKMSFTHMFNGKSHETAMLLAEKIKSIVPVPNASKVFFGCSG